MDKIYVLTSIEKNLIKIYEIDINYKLVALLNEIDNHQSFTQEVHLSSKPLSGYVF